MTDQPQKLPSARASQLLLQQSLLREQRPPEDTQLPPPPPPPVLGEEQIDPPPVGEGKHTPLQQSAGALHALPPGAHAPPPSGREAAGAARHFPELQRELQQLSSLAQLPPLGWHEGTAPPPPKHRSPSQSPSQQCRFCVQASPAVAQALAATPRSRQ